MSQHSFKPFFKQRSRKKKKNMRPLRTKTKGNAEVGKCYRVSITVPIDVSHCHCYSCTLTYSFSSLNGYSTCCCAVERKIVGKSFSIRLRFYGVQVFERQLSDRLPLTGATRLEVFFVEHNFPRQFYNKLVVLVICSNQF